MGYYSVTSFGKLDWKPQSPQWWSAPIWCLNTLQELSPLRSSGDGSTSKVLAMWRPAIPCTDVKCLVMWWHLCLQHWKGRDRTLDSVATILDRLASSSFPERTCLKGYCGAWSRKIALEKESPTHLPLNQSEMEDSMSVPSLAVMTEESEDYQFNLAWCFPQSLEIMRGTPLAFFSAAVFLCLLRCNTNEFSLIRSMLYLSNY